MAQSSMAQTLIRWRLNEVMARHGIRAKELAGEMEVSPTTVSNLRKRSMPRLTEETLNKLCQALNKLSQEGTLITPGDLIEYTPDPEPQNPKQEKNDGDQKATKAGQEKSSESQQSKQPSPYGHSKKGKSTPSSIAIVPELQESA